MARGMHTLNCITHGCGEPCAVQVSSLGPWRVQVSCMPENRNIFVCAAYYGAKSRKAQCVRPTTRRRL